MTSRWIRWLSIAVLGFGLTPLLDAAIAPLAAQTVQVNQVNIAIAPQPQESFARLVQRGEKLAAQTLNTRFKAKNSPSNLRVTVMGENNGMVAPLLSIAISRQAWLGQPVATRWATYYPDSQRLLGFRASPQLVPAASPPSIPPSVPALPPTAGSPSSRSSTPETQAQPKPKRLPIFEADPRDRPPEPPRFEDRLLTPARIEEIRSNPLSRDEQIVR
jgi:hypothetical protein